MKLAQGAVFSDRFQGKNCKASYVGFRASCGPDVARVGGPKKYETDPISKAFKLASRGYVDRSIRQSVEGVRRHLWGTATPTAGKRTFLAQSSL